MTRIQESANGGGASGANRLAGIFIWNKNHVDEEKKK
jgi:hypothetical protein